jgi:hypothetical protein
VAELIAFLQTGGYVEPEIELVCKELAKQILEEVKR